MAPINAKLSHGVIFLAVCDASAKSVQEPIIIAGKLKQAINSYSTKKCFLFHHILMSTMLEQPSEKIQKMAMNEKFPFVCYYAKWKSTVLVI